MADQIFDLEQQMMDCWNVTTDIEIITKWFVDDEQWGDMSPELCDALMNKYFAVQELYELKFERMFKTFEQVASEYHRRGREQ